MTRTTRRLRGAALALPLLLVPVLSLAACGDDGGGGDGVATLDEGAAGAGDDSGDGGGTNGERPTDDPEFQDAMLEYAQCMRDHGVDMPDPEFSDDGGVHISGPGPGGDDGGKGVGPDDEKWQEADEACNSIIEDAMPEEMALDPEEQAELQDRLVETAECMREKGYDMPDPEVDDKGRVSMKAGPGEGDNGPRPGDDQFEQDMEDCGGGPVRGPGGDSGNGSSTDETGEA
jgi:hypothetical protein